MSKVGINVDIADGKVVLAFTEPTTWLDFTPENAVKLAEALVIKAMKLGGQPHSDTIIIPRLN